MLGLELAAVMYPSQISASDQAVSLSGKFFLLTHSGTDSSFSVWYIPVMARCGLLVWATPFLGLLRSESYISVQILDVQTYSSILYLKRETLCSPSAFQLSGVNGFCWPRLTLWIVWALGEKRALKEYTVKYSFV